MRSLRLLLVVGAALGLAGCLVCGEGTHEKDSACVPDEESDADVDTLDGDGDGISIAEGDCDDSDPNISPTAADTGGDGIDQNCDGVDGVDADQDGYASQSSGGPDCDDANEAISPDTEEVWYDGIDQDCDGQSDYDQDGDGFDSDAYEGEDCDDTLPTTFPDADEILDGVDQDCDQGPDNLVLNWCPSVHPWSLGIGGPVSDPAGYEFGLIVGSERQEDCLTGVCHTLPSEGTATIVMGDSAADGITTFSDAQWTDGSTTYIVRLRTSGICYTWGSAASIYLAEGCIDFSLNRDGRC